jgi:hypothetical protein
VWPASDFSSFLYLAVHVHFADSGNNLVFISCRREFHFECPRCRLHMFRFSLLVLSLMALLQKVARATTLSLSAAVESSSLSTQDAAVESSSLSAQDADCRCSDFLCLCCPLSRPTNVTVPYGAAPIARATTLSLSAAVESSSLSAQDADCRCSSFSASVVHCRPFERHCPFWHCPKKSLQQQPCFYHLPSRPAPRHY